MVNGIRSHPCPHSLITCVSEVHGGCSGSRKIEEISDLQCMDTCGDDLLPGVESIVSFLEECRARGKKKRKNEEVRGGERMGTRGTGQ